MAVVAQLQLSLPVDEEAHALQNRFDPSWKDKQVYTQLLLSMAACFPLNQILPLCLVYSFLHACLLPLSCALRAAEEPTQAAIITELPVS